MNLSAATSIRLGSSPISSLYYGLTKVWPLSSWQLLGQNILGQSSNSQLGYAVAMSGDGTRVAVSAPYLSPGLVYVLDWDEAAQDWKTPAWQTYGFNPQATGGQSITIPNSSAYTNTQFGTSLALSRDGSTLAVGSGSGAVVVYRPSGENWEAIGDPIFQTTGNPITSQAKFGYSISLNANGSRLAVGVPDGTGYSGYATAYEFNGTAWVQMGANISSLTTGDKTGFSVAMNDEGNRMVIGARYGSTNSRGTARVVSWNGGSWSLISGEATIAGTANNDESGYSVAINSAGNYLAIGARYHDQPASNAGQVRVFYVDETGQPHQVGSSINGTAADDFSGASISLNAAGNIVAIGSELGDATGKANCGHVRVFKFTKDDPEAWSVSGLTQGTWSQVGSTLVGLAADDAFFTVSLNSAGDRLIVGGKFNDTNAANAGCARVFELTE